MTSLNTERFLVAPPPAYLTRPLLRLQPVLAKRGTPDIDLTALAGMIAGTAELCEPIIVESPAHWAAAIAALGDDVDAILPVSITAYPTEIWNSHPQPLIERGLPVIFWPIIQYDEPNFWRWSARDFLRALGVTVHLVKSNAQGLALLRALAMKRMLATAKLVVFGLQNFPWNANAAGHLVTRTFGTQLRVRALADFRAHAASASDAEVAEVWNARKGRYVEKAVRPDDLQTAVRTYLGIKAVLEEEQALGFGVNCFGELITEGGRDVPCLAQELVREDGYIAACDGDFLAMMSMALGTYLLGQTCMMSNMYPVQYVGALTDHFGDPLSPDATRYPPSQWRNLARMAHCGFGGVISPEMTPSGQVVLNDWGGTYEMKRDGRGCGVDGDMIAGRTVTAIQVRFDGRTLLLAQAEVCETTRHPLRHCESSILFKFRNLPDFIEHISREHTVFVYGDHIDELQLLAQVLGMECKVF